MVAVVLAAAVASAQTIPPAPQHYVYDAAGWLTPTEERALNDDLLAYERDSSNQIVVAIFPTLGDEDLADFSQRVAEAWEIGGAERDNGILLAIYAKERLLSIEVGYGLESVVTDAVAARIRDDVLVPAFRRGQRMEGITFATVALREAAGGEWRGAGRAVSDRYREKTGPSRVIGAFIILLVILVVFTVILRNTGDMVLGSPDFGRGGRYFPRVRIGGGRSGRSGGFGGGGLGGGFRGGGGSFGGGGARGGW